MSLFEWHNSYMSQDGPDYDNFAGDDKCLWQNYILVINVSSKSSQPGHKKSRHNLILWNICDDIYGHAWLS